MRTYPVLNEMKDPVFYDPGLSRARAGNDKIGAVDRRDSLKLRRVEPAFEIDHISILKYGPANCLKTAPVVARA